jgi:hypothetical protein
VVALVLKCLQEAPDSVLNITIIAGYLAWPSKRVSHLITTLPSTVINIIKQIQASITCEAK